MYALKTRIGKDWAWTWSLGVKASERIVWFGYCPFIEYMLAQREKRESCPNVFAIDVILKGRRAREVYSHLQTGTHKP